MTVTPEMLETGISASRGMCPGGYQLQSDQLSAIYKAMRALDPERERMIGALEHILAGALSLPRFAEEEARAILAEHPPRAATEIKHLQSQVNAMAEALAPFAREGEEWADLLPDDQPIQIQEPDDTSVYLAKYNLGDLRRAVAALKTVGSMG